MPGLPILMAVAMVEGSGTGSPRTIGAAPAAWKPSIRGRPRPYSVYPFQYAVMLPALPTGRQCTSGALPRTSHTSNDAVFWPSIRAGFTLLTRVTGWVKARSRARVRQSSKLPSTSRRRAPCTSAWASLPRAIFPVGTRTAQVSPPRAA